MPEPRGTHPVVRLALAVALVALAGCATVAPVDRGRFEANGRLVVANLDCGRRDALVAKPGAFAPGQPLRLTVWNIHKNGEPGWDADLTRFAAASDLVLLQEASLDPALRAILRHAGRFFVHADAWELGGVARGVLTASAAAPLEACVLRAMEPLLALPKSALVAWFRIEGRYETLAVANLHAINFAPLIGTWRDQIDALGAILANHRGPLVVAGDFNTWNAERVDALEAFARRLGLAEASLSFGEPARFLGRPVDTLFTRGIDVEDAWIEDVASSDHKPIVATIRISRP